MGTDIHLIVEQKRNGKWKRVDPPASYPRDPWVLKQIKEYEERQTDAERADPNGMYAYYIEKRDRDWYSHRNYRVFSILADVRNGHGFAGVKTGEGFVPISQPKGLPPDCSCYNGDDNDPKNGREPFGFGYHSFSWLTVKELLDYDWQQIANNCGVISWEEFVKRQETGFTGEPNGWSGSIGGGGIVTLEEAEAKKEYESEKALKAVIKDAIIDTKTKRFVRVWWKLTYSEATCGFDKNVVSHLAALDDNMENVRIVFGFDS